MPLQNFSSNHLTLSFSTSVLNISTGEPPLSESYLILNLRPSSISIKIDVTIMSGLRPFVFLELPFEVREMIYELLLVHKDAHKSYTRNLLPHVYHPINLNRWMLRIVPKYTRSWQPDYNLHPAILRTNSHVHAEASRILYGKNYFVWSASQPHRGNESLIFKHTNRLHLEVPPCYLRLITRLLLIFDCGDPKLRGNPKT